MNTQAHSSIHNQRDQVVLFVLKVGFKTLVKLNSEKNKKSTVEKVTLYVENEFGVNNPLLVMSVLNEMQEANLISIKGNTIIAH